MASHKVGRGLKANRGFSVDPAKAKAAKDKIAANDTAKGRAAPVRKTTKE